MGLLEGRVAIITGAGRGIGRATALALAREGAAVVVNDYDAEPGQETVDAIAAGGGHAIACPGDVTDPAFPEALVALTLRSFGGLHIIVNNAGYTWDTMVHKMNDEQWQAMLDIHATAPFRIIRAAASYIRDKAKEEAASGTAVMRKIVNVTSVSATRGNVGQANYAAAKSAVIGLTKTIAQEWGPFNVTCNAVAFGFISTRLNSEREKGAVGFGNIPIGIPAAQRDLILNFIPLRRPGLPEDAAAGILFLASPLSDYVTGHVLHVDGGLDM